MQNPLRLANSRVLPARTLFEKKLFQIWLNQLWHIPS
jgi:hypothetical protein